MMTKKENTRGRIGILVLISLVIIIGFSAYYYYYIKHKEPTQGIFVDNNEFQSQEASGGYIYQYS